MKKICTICALLLSALFLLSFRNNASASDEEKEAFFLKSLMKSDHGDELVRFPDPARVEWSIERKSKESINMHLSIDGKSFGNSYVGLQDFSADAPPFLSSEYQAMAFSLRRQYGAGYIGICYCHLDLGTFHPTPEEFKDMMPDCWDESYTHIIELANPYNMFKYYP